MSRFINPFPQFILASGSPNNGGLLVFFDTQTETPKEVFSDPNLTQNIGNEVRLNDSGSIPDIYLDGAYRVRLFDKTGQNQLQQADPIGVDTTNTAFNTWLVGNTYNIPDVVTGSDDRFYISLVDTNLGNDPTTQPSAFWEEILFVAVWNNSGTYRQGELVIASDGRTWQSQTGSNTGNDPTLDSGANWRQLLQVADAIVADNVTIDKTDAQSRGLRFVNDTFLRWQYLFDTDESMKLNRYDAAGLLIDSVFNFDVSTGDGVFTKGITLNSTLNVTGSIDFTKTGAFSQIINIGSDAAQQAALAFRDAGVDRWIIGQTSANFFSLARFDALGVLIDSPWFVDANGDVNFENNIRLVNDATGFIQDAGGALTFDFSDGIGTAIFDYFKNTNTSSGTRRVDYYKGDGTATVTCRIDAVTGTIHPSFDRAGEVDPGVKLGKITLSANAPVGGQDGDLWLRY
jgi:hypothetical protein